MYNKHEITGSDWIKKYKLKSDADILDLGRELIQDLRSVARLSEWLWKWYQGEKSRIGGGYGTDPGGICEGHI